MTDATPPPQATPSTPPPERPRRIWPAVLIVVVVIVGLMIWTLVSIFGSFEPAMFGVI